MKCIYCGEEFEQKSKKGIRKDYCDKIECKKKKQAEQMKKYYQKKKHGLPTRKKSGSDKSNKQMPSEIKESIQVPIQNEGVRSYREDEIIYVKNFLPVANELAMEVLDFARRLGAIKYEGEALKTKLSKETSKNDLEDSKFLHTIEAVQKLTVGEAIKLVVDAGEERAERRDTKTLHSIVRYLINGIPTNPHEYAQKAIKGAAKADVAYAIRSEESKLKNEREAK